MEISDEEAQSQDCGSECPYYDDEDLAYEERSRSSIAEDHDDHMIIETPEVRKAPFVIMTRADLAERQSRIMRDACELLAVTQEEAFALLHEFQWDLSRLQDAWFNDDAKVRERCGVGCSPAGSSSSASSSGPAPCTICFNNVNESLGLSCGHRFCKGCWTCYLHTAVDDGKAAVQARCPQHKCGRAVPPSFFRRLCDEERKQKYEEWYIRAYVDDNASVKWCPNPQGCSQACEYHGSDQFEIKCTCSFAWCWACGEEPHRPADCKTVLAWNIKNSNESENIGWIRANTKKCPKCHKPIEKNQGCNHMICSKAGGCGHEFCWLCLGEWRLHGTSTGGYYQCNIFEKNSKDGTFAEDEMNRQKAKHALVKYMFYFERFMNHDKSMKLTLTQEVEIEKTVQRLHDNCGHDVVELQFLFDAIKQVRACRRVLKWSYVYGYYLEDTGEKNLFEHLQKNLEEKTDTLHEMLEKLEKDFNNETLTEADHKDKFKAFRSNATNFTLVTQNWLKKILTDVGMGTALNSTGSSLIKV